MGLVLNSISPSDICVMTPRHEQFDILYKINTGLDHYILSL